MGAKDGAGQGAGHVEIEGCSLPGLTMEFVAVFAGREFERLTVEVEGAGFERLLSKGMHFKSMPLEGRDGLAGLLGRFWQFFEPFVEGWGAAGGGAEVRVMTSRADPGIGYWDQKGEMMAQSVGAHLKSGSKPGWEVGVGVSWELSYRKETGEEAAKKAFARFAGLLADGLDSIGADFVSKGSALSKERRPKRLPVPQRECKGGVLVIESRTRGDECVVACLMEGSVLESLASKSPMWARLPAWSLSSALSVCGLLPYSARTGSRSWSWNPGVRLMGSSSGEAELFPVMGFGIHDLEDAEGSGDSQGATAEGFAKALAEDAFGARVAWVGVSKAPRSGFGLGLSDTDGLVSQAYGVWKASGVREALEDALVAAPDKAVARVKNGL